MKDIKVSVDGLRWYKPNGRYIDEIWYSEAINEIIAQGQDKRILKTYAAIGERIWKGTIDTIQTNAYELIDHLKPVVEDLLVNAGWEVRIVDPLKRTEVEDYLHSIGGSLQVHEVPFSAELNIELRLDELCDTSGSIRTKEETLALLKERIGVETFDLEDETEDTRNHVLAILAAEELESEDLHDVCGRILTAGAQSFWWFQDDEEAEQEAIDYLTDDSYIWKEAVAADNTTDGLEEWAEDAIRIDGWAQIIGSYDGYERVAQLKDGTWFPYIRSN